MTDGPPAEGESYSDTADPEVLNARMRLDFVDWWSPAAVERPWVRLVTLQGREPFRAWWELGDRWDPDCGHSPVIEVAGISPGDGPRIELPQPVDTVGWWILTRIDLESARRWVAAGITNPFDTSTWGTALGQFLPSELGCRPLAAMVKGRWRPTPEGYDIVAELLRSGVNPSTLWGPGCRRHLEIHAPDVLWLLAS